MSPIVTRRRAGVEGTYGVARGWVFGIEGDWSATKLSATQNAPNLFPNGTPIGFGSITFMETTKSLASIRARAGVAVVPNVLLYATMGVARLRLATDWTRPYLETTGSPTAGEYSATTQGRRKNSTTRESSSAWMTPHPVSGLYILI
jgi:opacity protein-like surface antigen